MFDLLAPLLDTRDFPARWECGHWTPLHGYLHVASDILIWLAYTAIPIVLGIVVWRRRDLPFPRVLWLFVLFILACGLTHLNDAIIFWHPVYRLQGLAKGVTAIASVATVCVLITQLPAFLSMPGVRELTARLAAEQRGRERVIAQLRDSERQRAEALAAGGIGTWWWDIEKDIADLDDRANVLLGLPPERTRLPSSDFFQRVHPEDVERLRREVAASHAGRAEYDSEYRVVWPDGTVRWIAAKGSVERDERGRPLTMTGTMQDITRDVRIEEVQARLSAIVDAVPDAIIMQDLDGRVLHWNAGATENYGYTAEQMVGTSIHRIVPRERADEIIAFQEAARAGNALTSIHSQRLRSDGQRIDVSLSLAPIRQRDGSVRAITSIEHDISNRVRAERSLRAANDRLQAQNEEMEIFTYTVSHDLKSPLVTIQGFLGLLREELPAELSEDAEDALRRIEAGTIRMAQLIEDLLNLSRVGRAEYRYEPVDLEAAMSELRARVAIELSAAEAELEVVGALPTLYADRERLLQALTNLVGNALKYGIGPADRRVSIGCQQEADECRVFIRDYGPGIDPAYHQRIFRMFERLQTDRGGTGIGLAIVARIMQRHDGRVWIESQPGQGATFWLAFPRHGGPASAPDS